MVYRRIELTPAEQLKGLCETRDRYTALADSLRESSDPLLDPDMQLAKERDARRIAHAYEKSIANSMVRMSSLGQTRQIRLPSLSARTWLAFFMVIAVLEGGLLLAYFRPAIFQNRPAPPRLAVHRVDRVASLPPVAQPPPPIIALPKPAAPPPIAALPKPAAQPRPVSVAPKPSAQPAAPPPIAALPKPAAQLPPPVFVAPRPAAQPQSPPSSAVPPQPAAQPQTPPPAIAIAPKPIALPPVAAAPIVQPQASPPAVSQPSTQAATPAPVATFTLPSAPPQATAPPQAAQPVQPLTRLEPVTQTHSLPPYPPIAKSLGEEGTTRMRVAISLQGAVTDCAIVKTSGSARLDGEACNYVQGHWRWNPPTRNGQPVTAATEVNIVWSLKVRP